MNTLRVGYASVTVNPPMNIAIYGYYVPRFAKGILDDIEAAALALSDGKKTIIAISVDNCGIDKPVIAKIAEAVARTTGVPKENLFIAATHSHTAPCTSPSTAFPADDELIRQYAEFLTEKIAEAAKAAVADLTPAKMGFAVGRAPDKIAYIRRYKMKDGSTLTCPPIDDPNIDYPLGTLDQRVNVLRFKRDDADDVVILNYGLHADTVNGELISADWVGWLRKTVKISLDGAKCMFFAGAEGDVGSTNVHPSGGDMNDTEISFDNEMKSPGMARFVGRALAGTVLQVFDKVTFTDVNDINIIREDLIVPANVPDEKDLPLAHEYKRLHEAGRDCDIPYKAMELTTVVAEALRMCNMENGPETFSLPMTGLKIGSVALVGIPGEPFTDIGVRIKEEKGWDMILPCALVNGNEGYFPVGSAFDEGGYEARTSPYKSTIAKDIADCAAKMLKKLKSEKE